MLKKISFFALAALVFVGCSSNDEEAENKKSRNFKDAVYAFVNTQPNVVGYGRLNVNTIMDESNMEQNSMFQMFAAPTYNGLKEQVDVNTPVYLAATTTENHSDLTMYWMFKLKDKDAFVKDFKEMGYEFKEHNGIKYAEDDGYVFAANGETVMAIIIPGDFDAKKLVTEAYKSTEGKIADGDMKKNLEKDGDFVMHMNMDALKANDPSLAMLPNATEVDFSLNFDNGKMVFESQVENFDQLKGALGLAMSDEPIVAKKLTDEKGNVIAAVQLSAESKMMNLLGMDADGLSSAMNAAPLMMEDVEANVTVSDLTDADNVTMPSGEKIGDQYMELLINIDAIATMVPEYKEYEAYITELDYAAVSVMEDGTFRVTVTTDNQGQNFLATILKTVDDFMNNGGLMKVMAMQ